MTMIWRIRQIFDGDYGCEDAESGGGPKVSVTVVNDAGEVRTITVQDAWLTRQGLDEGSVWPTDRVILASQSPRRKELLHRILPAFEILPAQGEEQSAAADPHDYVRELSYHKAQEIMNRVAGDEVSSHPVLPDLEQQAAAGIAGALYVIGSDTIVVCDGQIMGKPRDRADAYDMIHRLQGRSHEVMTGVTILKRDVHADASVLSDIPGTQNSSSWESLASLLESDWWILPDDSQSGAYLSDTEKAADSGPETQPIWTAMESYTCVTRVTVAPMTDDEIHRYLITGEADDKAGAYGIQGAFSLYVTGIEGSYSNVVGLPVAALYQSLKRMGMTFAVL